MSMWESCRAELAWVQVCSPQAGAVVKPPSLLLPAPSPALVLRAPAGVAGGGQQQNTAQSCPEQCCAPGQVPGKALSVSAGCLGVGIPLPNVLGIPLVKVDIQILVVSACNGSFLWRALVEVTGVVSGVWLLQWDPASSVPVCKSTLWGQKGLFGLTSFRTENAAECFVPRGATKLGTT